MFCKINGKYYVKVSNFYQEVKVEGDNIVPIQGEENRLYSPVQNCEQATVEEILKASKKETKELFKEDRKDNRKIF